MDANNDARQLYTQAVLAGWSDKLQQGKESSDTSSSDDKAYGEVPPKFWEQGSYIVFVPVVIKQVDVPNDGYGFDVQLALDVDIPVRLYRSRSQKMSQFVTYLLAEKTRDNSPKLRMGARISEDGINPLSLADEHQMGSALAHVFSRVMGALNRAARCIVYESVGQENKVAAGSGNGSTPTSEAVGEPKKKRRSSKVYGEVLPKNLPEESADMVELDGEVLGV